MALILALQRLGDLLGARKLVSFSQVAQTFDEGRRGVVGFGRRDQLLLAGRIIYVLQIPPYDGLIGFHGFLLYRLSHVGRTALSRVSKSTG
jgi:hypothetical protein